MPTVKQVRDWAIAEVGKGNGELHMPQPVIMEREEAKRKRNAPDDRGKRKTRIVWEAGDPDVYALFHSERSRYMAVAGNNPVLATELLITALRLHGDDELKSYLETIGTCGPC
jgi:hypothetical protein